MAFIDSQLEFDVKAQHLTTGASTNVIDLGAARDLGVGEPIMLVVDVTTAMTDAGNDSTMTVTVETDATDAFSSPTTTQTVGTFAAGSAVGTSLKIKLSPGTINEKVAQLKYTVANGNLTTGSFSAYLVLDQYSGPGYPAAVTSI